MAFALIGNTSAGSTTGNNVTTAGIDTTGADLIVVGIVGFADVAAATLSDSKGNTSWTALTARSGGSGSVDALVWYHVNPTVGTGHTFTGTTSGGFPAIAVLAFSGSHATPFEEENGVVQGSDVTSQAVGSVSPSDTASSLAVAFIGFRNAVTLVSVDSTYTISNSQAGSGTNFPCSMAYKNGSLSAAENPTFSWTTASKVSAEHALFLAAAASDSTPPFFRSLDRRRDSGMIPY